MTLRIPLSPTLLGFGGLAWLVALVSGFSILMTYSATPGRSAHTPAAFPPSAVPLLDSDRPTLMVLAHPCCPCTRATIQELDRLVARCSGRMKTLVFFQDMPEAGIDRASCSDLWDQAESIPGVEVRADLEGSLACALGVRTSGQVLLYAPDGRLLFEGGITGARGHAGDNEGESAVESWLQGRAPVQRSTPVYGCALASCAEASVPEVRR